MKRMHFGDGRRGKGKSQKVESVRNMADIGLRRALATATGSRKAAIEKELMRRSISAAPITAEQALPTPPPSACDSLSAIVKVTDVERITVTGQRIKRDASFRARVLAAYGTSCVICGYSHHVEAAHLNPKHQISDDRTENGAPLCPNHHWELDNGLLKVEEVQQRRRQ